MTIPDKLKSWNQKYRRKQLDRKPIEQRRAGRDDGLPLARHMIGRKACGQVPANGEHL